MSFTMEIPLSNHPSTTAMTITNPKITHVYKSTTRYNGEQKHRCQNQTEYANTQAIS